MLYLLLACSVPTSDFEVFAGFDVEWDALSHRVSRLEVANGEDGPEMAVVGGDWSTGEQFSDFLKYRFSSLDIRDARAGFAQVRIPFRIEPRGLDDEGEYAQPGTAEGLGEVEIFAVGSWPEYTAVVQGFGIRTDVQQSASFPTDYDPGHGYALGRLSLAVSDVVRGEEALSVGASLTFEPAPTGEGLLDRPAMDASIPLAAFEGWVDVGIIGHERAGTSIPLDTKGTHPYSPPYSPQEAVEMPLNLGSGRIGFWQSLHFEVNPGGHGDYIRAIGAEMVGHEEVEGVRLNLTNSSAFELGALTYSIQGQVALLGLGRRSQAYLRVREGEADVGSWQP